MTERNVPPIPSRAAYQLVLLGAAVSMAVCLVTGVRYFQETGSGDLAQTGRQFLPFFLSVLSSSAFLAAHGFRAHTGSEVSLWKTVGVLIALCLVGQGVIWHLLIVENSPKLQERDVMRTPTDVTTYLTKHHILDPVTGKSKTLQVLTGVFIRSMEFTTANNVVLTGYVWQKYPLDFPKTIEQGVVLPEAEEAYDLKEAFRKKQDDGELVGWYFRATLRQQFNYDDYPFDRQDVWLRMWHHNFDRGALLLPDLRSYASLDPKSRPGVEQDFVQQGWRLDNSYFSYRTMGYNSNFGFNRFNWGVSFPELYFNVEVKREFMRALIEHMIPLAVVSLMLFALLFIGSGDLTRNEKTGFTGQDAMAFTAAIFFVVILSHIQLRSAIPATSVMYLEYYYFAMYFAIIGITANVVLLTSPIEVHWLEYRDNLIPKLLFWPVLLVPLLVLSVVRYWH